MKTGCVGNHWGALPLAGQGLECDPVSLHGHTMLSSGQLLTQSLMRPLETLSFEQEWWVWPVQSSQGVWGQVGARGKASNFTGLQWEARVPLRASSHRHLLTAGNGNAQRLRW